MPADSRPAGPGKPTSCHRLVGFTLVDPRRLPPVSKPTRHLVMIVAHLAVRMAFAVVSKGMFQEINTYCVPLFSKKRLPTPFHPPKP